LESETRWNRIVTNDLENLPLGVLMAILTMLIAAHPIAHVVFFAIFAFARTIHTIAFARAAQPWRTIFYFVGVLGILGMGINGIVGLWRYEDRIL